MLGFFICQIILLLKVARKNDFISIKAICVDKHAASFGNKMSSKIYSFASFDEENFPGITFEIQIANGSESKKIDKIHLDSAYEFIFNRKTDEDKNLILNNATMISYSRIALPNASEEEKNKMNKKRQREEEKLQKSA